MSTDFIGDLGTLAIVSRLRRLTERLTQGGGEVYRALRIDFEPRWFALFYLLYTENSPLSILAIAEALRISHPAVIQTARILVRKGLVRSYQDRADRRRRRLVITPKGKELARSLAPVWEAFVDATTDLFRAAGPGLIETIARLESELDREELDGRILRLIKARQKAAVEIVDYSSELRASFRALNEEWLEEYFRVEEADRRILDHPEKEILRRGGAILFARLEGKIVGTAALIKHDDSTYELAKMAVTAGARGKQAGRKLAEAALARARELGAKTVHLWTDKKLKAAVDLYRNLGFRPTLDAPEPSDAYTRRACGMAMTLDIGG